MSRVHRWSAVALALPLVFLITSCGQELKKENEQLKSQVAALQQENVELKGQVTSLKADAEALKTQFEGLSKEMQVLEEKLKEAEARASAKPGTRPPLRSKKSS
jgi:chromosome segregation ATPase